MVKKSAKTEATAAPQLYIVGERYRWITYIEEGQEEDPIQVEVKIRKNLLQGELEDLDITPLPADLNDMNEEARTALLEVREEEIREQMAPYVVDWNVGYRTPSGESVKADPPAIAGGKQFGKYLPARIVGQIYLDLRIRSTGLVKAKSSTPHESTESTTGDEPSIPTGTPSD